MLLFCPSHACLLFTPLFFIIIVVAGRRTSLLVIANLFALIWIYKWFRPLTLRPYKQYILYVYFPRHAQRDVGHGPGQSEESPFARWPESTRSDRYSSTGRRSTPPFTGRQRGPAAANFIVSFPALYTSSTVLTWAAAAGRSSQLWPASVKPSVSRWKRPFSVRKKLRYVVFFNQRD